MNDKSIFMGITALLLIAGIFGCGTINSHRIMEQPVNTTLSAGIGSEIFRLNKLGDLPNVYGGRDIQGGKVDKGFSEMRLIGIEGPVLTLEVLDVSKASTETVMDRYNRNAVMAVDVHNNVNIGNSETAKPTIIKFDTSKQKEIVIAGVKVTFNSVQSYSVEYEIKDVQAG